MNDIPPVRYDRSPEMMSAHDTAVVVVDVQEKLIGLIPNNTRIVWNIRRLLDGAKILDLETAATEQYPKGLGPTVPELAERLGDIPEKLHFSCAACGELFGYLREQGRHKILLCGIEAHVCVQQTALDLIAGGFRVYLAVDAIGSRFDTDREVAIRRMEGAGVTLTTTEAALFEWCEVSGSPQFKQISALVREAAPE